MLETVRLFFDIQANQPTPGIQRAAKGCSGTTGTDRFAVQRHHGKKAHAGAAKYDLVRFCHVFDRYVAMPERYAPIVSQLHQNAHAYSRENVLDRRR